MLKKFYYGIVKTPNGIKKYVACDDHSGGYAYVTNIPAIFFDTKYLESCKKDSYIKAQLESDYTLTIFEVNPEMPFYEAVTAV
jgi:hypothetical protein